MKKKYAILLLITAIGLNIQAQVSISTDHSEPAPSAMLDVQSTSKGMLIPRMTIAERNAIAQPANGLLVFCTDNGSFYVNRGSETIPEWIIIGNLTGVTANAPIISSGGDAPNISLPQAGSSTNGYLSSADWITFSNKQNALVFGSVLSPDMTITGGSGAVVGNGLNMTIKKGALSESSSSVLTITNGANSVLGTGTSIAVKKSYRQSVGLPEQYRLVGL